MNFRGKFWGEAPPHDRLIWKFARKHGILGLGQDLEVIPHFDALQSLCHFQCRTHRQCIWLHCHYWGSSSQAVPFRQSSCMDMNKTTNSTVTCIFLYVVWNPPEGGGRGGGWRPNKGRYGYAVSAKPGPGKLSPKNLMIGQKSAQKPNDQASIHEL